MCVVPITPELYTVNDFSSLETSNPGTMLQIEGREAYITLKNSSNENSDGSCETKIIFEDHTDTILAQIQASLALPGISHNVANQEIRP